ncbi:MAG: hypothetical protein COB02_13960 [Candidatus Cloacimonadota bacterium]|nr:MAG: hypothetical protein COB02_13960 [Candidatus Cloacimonadota bacterium]
MSNYYDYEKLLNQYKVSNSKSWIKLLKGLTTSQASSILRQLIPDYFCSNASLELHQSLKKTFPEFLKMIENTSAYFSSFPKSGIPAQSKSISTHVSPNMNAGIGIAKNSKSQILINSKLQETIDYLKPQSVSEQNWLKLTQSLFKYNNGLGAPWYRHLAKSRYLLDIKNKDLYLTIEKSLSISPIPVFGGTSGLNSVLDMFGGAGTPIVFPSTYWGNMNLISDQKGLLKIKSDYIDINGDVHLNKLEETLNTLKEKGFHKVCLYFNFPHNPSGVVLSKKQALSLSKIIQKHACENFQIINVCDEPYFPFVRGKQAIKSPISAYLQPLYNKNIITFATINGTKRDGMYGFRHSDLIILLAHDIEKDTINEIENNLLAGYFRGCFSFSNSINQYLLARSLSQDPLVALKSPHDLEISQDYLKSESDSIQYMQECMNHSISFLDQISHLKRVQQTEDACGGFFASYQLDEVLVSAGITTMDIHQIGLKHNVGVISAGSYIRINGLIETESIQKFCSNLQETIDSLLMKKN